MKLIKLNIFPVIAILLSTSSLAQSLEANQVSTSDLASTTSASPSVVFKSTMPESQSQKPSSGLAEGISSSRRLKLFRTKGLSMTNSRSNLITKNDSASLTMKAPTPTINGALSLVGTIYQTRLNSTATKWIQVLSLAATRKINAEFSYTAKLDKNSSINSVISYRLHPRDSFGRSSDAAASIKYNFNF